MALDNAVVKSIGSSGQISLGKEYAGRQVLVETPKKGVWIIRTVTIVPDEVWLHEKETKEKLESAISWAVKNPTKLSDPNKLRLKNGNFEERKPSSVRSKKFGVSKV